VFSALLFFDEFASCKFLQITSNTDAVGRFLLDVTVVAKNMLIGDCCCLIPIERDRRESFTSQPTNYHGSLRQ
jgi:hypothetical protein